MKLVLKFLSALWDFLKWAWKHWRYFPYALGMVSGAYAPAFLVGFLMFFYHPGEGNRPIYMGLGAFVFVQFIGRLMDSVSDPLVGYFSDKTKSRWGRRIPYIIFGTPVMAITMVLVWFPLTDHPSLANILWLTFNLLVFWLCYTIVVAPHLSLLPEIAPDNVERNRLGGVLGLGEVVGTLFGAAIFAMLIDAYLGGVDIGPLHFSDGYKFVGLLAGIGVLITFWPTWWFVKEDPYKESKEVNYNFYQSVKETLKNPSYPHFLIMIALLRLLVDVVFVALPYYVTQILFLDLGFVALLSASIIVGAVVFFPLVIWASNKYGKKSVFLAALGLFALVLPCAVYVPVLDPNLKFTLALPFTSISFLVNVNSQIIAAAIFAFLAPGAASFLVLSRVILTDVMDFDEKITGFRREAMYNGIEGLITKFAAGVAPMIVALCIVLFDTPEYPLGALVVFAIDGAIALIAFIIFIPYPIRK